MSLQTPTTIRNRQWKLISQGEDTSRDEVSSLDTSIKRPTIVGLVVKPIGKPSAGNRHAGFDERGWETGAGLRPQATAPILDSTECDHRRAANDPSEVHCGLHSVVWMPTCTPHPRSTSARFAANGLRRTRTK